MPKLLARCAMARCISRGARRAAGEEDLVDDALAQTRSRSLIRSPSTEDRLQARVVARSSSKRRWPMTS